MQLTWTLGSTGVLLSVDIVAAAASAASNVFCFPLISLRSDGRRVDALQPRFLGFGCCFYALSVAAANLFLLPPERGESTANQLLRRSCCCWLAGAFATTNAYT